MNSKISATIVSIGIPLLVIAICSIFVANIDRNIWTEVTKHSDEFVFDHESFNGNYIVMKLYDRDSTYVCEAFMSVRDRKTAIFNDTDLLASSANSFRSRKMYKLLVKNVPEGVIVKNNVKENTLKKLKSL